MANHDDVMMMKVVEAHKETLGSCRVSLPSFIFTKNLSSTISLNQLLTISQPRDPKRIVT